ncbi:MAG TPA: CBS domain-containing protein [Thermoanaerobaculia bacterium]|nr:CBS domain-containing protein [Thermoanaerobaculia bacterium]
MALERMPDAVSVGREGRFLHFSHLVARRIVDRDGNLIGRLRDLSIRLGEPYPPIQQVYIRPAGQAPFVLIASGRQVSDWTSDPIVLSAKLSELRPGRRQDETQILLGEALLDKQVVDVSGAKVERVNDLSLLLVGGGELVLAHIDVGLRGLVRRLGWEKAVDGSVRAFRPKARYLRLEQLIGWKYVLPTVADPAGLRLVLSQKSITRIHPADLAEILEDLPPGSRKPIFEALETSTAARVLSEFDDPKVKQDLLAEASDPQRAADVLETMPPDAAADVLAELPEDTAQELLSHMEPEDAKAVTHLMSHEEDTAGALMTTEVVTFPRSLTVAEAFQRLRDLAPELEFLYQFYVVDERRRLIGAFNIRRLFLFKETETLEHVMAPWTICVHPEDSASEVAAVIEKYNLAAVPVVDAEGVLVGMITVDDVLTEVLPIAWKKKLHL